MALKPAAVEVEDVTHVLTSHFTTQDDDESHHDIDKAHRTTTSDANEVIERKLLRPPSAYLKYHDVYKSDDQCDDFDTSIASLGDSAALPPTNTVSHDDEVEVVAYHEVYTRPQNAVTNPLTDGQVPVDDIKRVITRESSKSSTLSIHEDNTNPLNKSNRNIVVPDNKVVDNKETEVNPPAVVDDYVQVTYEESSGDGSYVCNVCIIS